MERPRSPRRVRLRPSHFGAPRQLVLQEIERGPNRDGALRAHVKHGEHLDGGHARSWEHSNQRRASPSIERTAPCLVRNDGEAQRTRSTVASFRATTKGLSGGLAPARTAMSTPSVKRSTKRSSNRMSSFRRGCVSRRAGNSGPTCARPNETGRLMTKSRAAPRPGRSASRASSTPARSARDRARKSVPASVSDRCRVVRRTSSTPRLLLERAEMSARHRDREPHGPGGLRDAPRIGDANERPHVLKQIHRPRVRHSCMACKSPSRPQVLLEARARPHDGGVTLPEWLGMRDGGLHHETL